MNSLAWVVGERWRPRHPNLQGILYIPISHPSTSMSILTFEKVAMDATTTRREEQGPTIGELLDGARKTAVGPLGG